LDVLEKHKTQATVSYKNLISVCVYNKSCISKPQRNTAIHLSIFHWLVSQSVHQPVRIIELFWTGNKAPYSVPWTRTIYGDRAFSTGGRVVWNSLPAAVREADSLCSFKH